MAHERAALSEAPTCKWVFEGGVARQDGLTGLV